MKPRDLRLLIMHVATRCDQTCAHCSIWKSNGNAVPELGVAARLAVIDEARSLGARAILFTGGEPLLCDHLETLVRAANGFGLSVQIATNGLGLSRSSSWLTEVVSEVYVSLEGPEDIHDGVRGPRMFSRLKASLADTLSRPERPRLIGRSVISARNAAVLEETVLAARSLGLDAVSFLPVDTTSGAFGGDPAARGSLHPRPSEVAELRKSIDRLGASGELGTFVMEDERTLTRIADGFGRAASSRSAPACNAPEWSSVVEANGVIRPCFFQPGVVTGQGRSLGAVRRSVEYAGVLGRLGEGNRICADCVCPKHVATGVASLRGRVGAVLARVLPPSAQRARSSA